jgi:hypothetical protein
VRAGGRVGVLSADVVADEVRRVATSPLLLLEGVLRLCRQDAVTCVDLFVEPTAGAPAGPAAATAGADAVQRAGGTEAGADAVRRQRDRHLKSLAQMTEVATEFFRRDWWPSQGEVADLVDDLMRRFPRAEPVLVPRALAFALDEQHALQIRAEFDLHPPGTLLNDRVLPVPPADLLDAYARKFGQPVSLTSQPAHMYSAAFHVDRTAHFRLCTPPAGMNVYAQTWFTDDLDLVDRIPHAATVAPLGPGDARTSPPATPAGSFGHGPLDADAAWETTKAMLARAAAEQVQVAVVPELDVGASVTPDLMGEDVPTVVLCGSRHVVTADGAQVNEATVHVNGVLASTHHKMHPLQNLLDPSQGEDIVPGRRVELLFSRRWSVATLICADVNLLEVIRLVEDLGVNLLLVASMTTRPGFFEGNLRAIAEHNQALVVWANDPLGSPQVATSMFIFPSRTRSVVSRRLSLPRTARHNWSRH